MDNTIISKIAKIASLEVNENELEKINKFTLLPVTADEVFVFKVVMADNGQDDRNYMPFNLKSLQDLQKKYIGKTFLFDHSAKAEKQIARIYDTELVEKEKAVTEIGEPMTQLVGKVYMIKTSQNADLIAEINGGIKKEVSTSCFPEKLTCNVCGTDNIKTYCPHIPGKDYENKDGTKTKCKLVIDGCKEAIELSFVAVPAQPRAGTCKEFAKTENSELKKHDAENENILTEVSLFENYVFCEKNKEDKNYD